MLFYALLRVPLSGIISQQYKIWKDIRSTHNTVYSYSQIDKDKGRENASLALRSLHFYCVGELA